MFTYFLLLASILTTSCWHVLISRGRKTYGRYRKCIELTAYPFLKGPVLLSSSIFDLFLQHTCMHKKWSLHAKIDFINPFSLQGQYMIQIAYIWSIQWPIWSGAEQNFTQIGYSISWRNGKSYNKDVGTLVLLKDIFQISHSQWFYLLTNNVIHYALKRWKRRAAEF